VFVKFQVGAMNPEFQKIVDLIPNIPHCGEKAALRKTIDPTKMLPSMYKQMSIVLFKSSF